MSAARSLMYLPLFLVVCLSILCSGAREDESKCFPKSIDRCGSDFFLFHNEDQIASIDRELKKQCNLFMDQITCTTQVVKTCWNQFFTNIISGILNDLYVYIDGICTSGSPLNQLYMGAVGCLNKAGPVVHKETVKFRIRLHEIVKYVSYKDRIDYACCAYSKFHKEAVQLISKECPGDDKAIRLYGDIFNQTVGRGIKPACSGYDWSTMWCTALPEMTSRLNADQAEGLAGPVHDILISWQLKYT